MKEVFFVLYVFAGSGNDQSTFMDHFDTLVECEAAKSALVRGTAGWWQGRVYLDYAICLEARP